MKHSNRLHTVLIAALVIVLCLSIIPVITMATQNTRANNEIGFPTTAQDNPAEEEDGDIRVPIGSLPATNPSDPTTEPSEPSTEPSEPSTEPSEPSTEPSQPEGVLGDFTGDNSVNNEDVVHLLWHTLFPSQYPITGTGDFTDDNSVNNEDVVHLLWHTLFPNQYPLN